jgi:8-hydroxy-5-deazaflavin:NADPH oxidoreductase
MSRAPIIDAHPTSAIGAETLCISQPIPSDAAAPMSEPSAAPRIFSGVIADDKPLDVFFVGDSAEAKTRIAELLESMDLRPLDAGGLEMAYVLEWAGILLVGVARNGAGFDLAFGVSTGG